MKISELRDAEIIPEFDGEEKLGHNNARERKEDEENLPAIPLLLENTEDLP